MSRPHVLKQLPFRIVPSVASGTDDPSHLWLRHVRLPSECSLLAPKENDFRLANSQPFQADFFASARYAYIRLSQLLQRNGRTGVSRQASCSAIPLRFER
jgi:hypothetical protein